MERIEELQEERQELQEWLKSPVWVRHCKVMQAQIDARKPVIMKPLDSMNGLPSQEFMKGEIAAFELMMKMPQLLLEEATRQLNELVEKEDETV